MPISDPADLTDLRRAELDAACNALSAERTDLESLLAAILRQQVARPQVADLLRQAHARLAALRAGHAAGPGRTTGDPAIDALLNQAGRALETGAGFSLDAADRAFETAYRQCQEHPRLRETAAAVCAAQAGIAAISQDHRRAAALNAVAATTPGLADALRWRYQFLRAGVLEDLGREFMDRAALEEAIECYQTTVLDLAPRAQRPDDWAATQDRLGHALGVLGQRQSGTWLLERSIAAFENALCVRARERVPLDWAATQNHLGNALGILAQRQSDTGMLERSIAAFEAALEEQTAERDPHGRTTTQNNLGAALLNLGQRNKDAQMLKRAVEAYKDVLSVWTRERGPLVWATTMNNLGTALRALGEHRKGPRTLEQAVAAYRSALAERTRKRVPRDWAMTQNNLGAALQKLGERLDDPRILRDAVEAYECALDEGSRKQMPLGWAMTRANLGAARRELAERTRDAGIARLAVADFDAVADVFRKASHAQLYELAEEQLAKARALADGLAGAAQS